MKKEILDLNNNLPLITVITAVYNGEKYLEESIRSVIDQSYPNIQYILIDGGSTDNTISIVKKYSDRIAHWVSEPDKGIYDAWNKGLRSAKGDWVCFIGADDYFLTLDTLATAATFLKSIDTEQKKYVYGKIHQVLADKSAVIEVLGTDWQYCRKQFSKEMTLAHCGSFHHCTLFKEYGNFNTNFKIAGDYEFLLRAYGKNRDFAYHVDLPVVGMRTGGISGNLNNRLLMARETNIARKLNGINSISLPIVLWVVRIRFYIMLTKVFGTGFSNYLADCYRIMTGKKKRWSN